MYIVFNFKNLYLLYPPCMYLCIFVHISINKRFKKSIFSKTKQISKHFHAELF